MSFARSSGPPADAEWLLVDGTGGYACGSVDDLQRRRYHALWIARPPGDARRRNVVSALDERIVDGARVVHLLHAHWRDLPAPSRPQAEVAFVHRPLPTWTWRAGGDVLERAVALRRAAAGVAPACLVRWTNRGPNALRLHVRPLLGWCDADHLPPADERFDGALHARGASWGVRPNDGLPMLWLTVDGVAACRAEPAWYRGFLYATDRARGYDHVGDRWTPGVLELELGPGRSATLAFALGEPCENPAAAFLAAATAAAAAADAAGKTAPRATAATATTAATAAPAAAATPATPPAAAGPAAAATTARANGPDVAARLARGADDFLYRDDHGRLGVLAGFPWFGEWGRDVFVALPGLTLARGRADLCADALRGALPFLRDGLLPNIYGATAASSHYDSCDAALWFALAVARFADAGGDARLVRDQLVPALAGIARAYQQGTGLGLAVEPSGLLRAGREDLNATWMDARVRGVPVTPRAGLPVEIQALWYSLLALLAEHDAKVWAGARDRCGTAFVRAFWRDDRGCLADRVHGGVADLAVRPNMVIAAALPRSPLTPAQRGGVVTVARGQLLTPVGLRTLSPLEPGYRGRYEGGIDERDGAYHQGTAWPWLLGFLVEAALAAAPAAARADEARRWREQLDALAPELERAGLDHVSEVFDGDPPHRPGGTFAQAWNTGELLRAYALVAEAAK